MDLGDLLPISFVHFFFFKKRGKLSAKTVHKKRTFSSPCSYCKRHFCVAILLDLVH